MKRIVAILAACGVVACMLTIVACKVQTPGSTSAPEPEPAPSAIVLDTSSATVEMEGVTFEVTNATLGEPNEYGGIPVHVEIAITNNTDEDVTKVIYNMVCVDEQGNEIFTAAVPYVAPGGVIAPGETVVDIQDYTHAVNGVAYAMNIEALEVDTASEMPPVVLPETGEYLYEYLMVQGMPDITQTTPASITVGIDQGGYLREAVFDDPVSVKAATDAFAQIRIGDATTEMVTDNYNYIILAFEDGQQYRVSLNLHNLEVNQNGMYWGFNLDGLGTLWSMAEENAVDVVDYGYVVEDA